MKKYVQWFFFLYLIGFGAGVLCANFLRSDAGYQTSLLSVYLADNTIGKIPGKELFMTLCGKRGVWFFLYLMGGITPFGVLLVLGGLLWLGFLAGNLATAFLMAYGMKGILIGLSCFFPQGLFYIPGIFLFFFFVVQMSQKFWSRKETGQADYKAYLFFMTGAAVLLLLAVFMESYVNQDVLQYIVKHFIQGMN